jgi:hypothetical protein
VIVMMSVITTDRGISVLGFDAQPSLQNYFLAFFRVVDQRLIRFTDPRKMRSPDLVYLSVLDLSALVLSAL